MKRKISPRPWRQAERAHRRRKALGRALHKIRAIRGAWFAKLQQRFRTGRPMPKFKVPKTLRKHGALLTRTLMVSGY